MIREGSPDRTRKHSTC